MAGHDKARQRKASKEREGRKWGSVGDTEYRTGTYLNMWEYISGGISQGPVRCFPFFLKHFFVSCQTFGFYGHHSRLDYLFCYFI